MKVLVAVKSVVDYNIKVHVKSDNSAVQLDNLKMSINPFDEVALEEAIRLKEQGIVSEIIVVSCGDISSKNILQYSLAMGADRAIWCESTIDIQPLAIAKILKVIVESEEPQMVFLGKQSIDNDAAQTGQILSGILNYSQATFASKLEFVDEELFVTSEADSGNITISVKLPTVITVDLSLNSPRYISLQNIIKSKKKNIDHIKAEEICRDISPRFKVLRVEELKKNKKVVLLNDVDLLINKLRNEAKVI
ncbi:electron transfer flavoprotein beta subunit [Candidatus Kinetoplastibacterium desouzaii TCC079E]|uniref:Electron transfer flavoprotein subunit beta n=1 Tax=Candidatus Kinetoplastidibacterium desouzai TCC079E TaxID=1208919 RepID=M1LML7_9PROT|nr:electron transfer flavoprotein subunit beta/FixA family protein [Candidatus Kinetoplastibacterium desouzaii]AGF46972.1 electron transfer flavoprotein beta subunit [Candidatus Kinetoplastibacterium desouzaii TCC079E]